MFMLYAIHNGERINPIPKSSATCPFCQSEMLSKCGAINIWHWAHRNREACDFWKESESEWHRGWKSKFPVEDVEKILEKFGKKHIADYYNHKQHVVVEFQKSPLSFEDKMQREAFYPNLTWVFRYDGKGLLGYADGKRYEWNHATKWFIKGMNRNCKYFIDIVYKKQLFQITDVTYPYIRNYYDASEWSDGGKTITLLHGQHETYESFIDRYIGEKQTSLF
jgi:competence CoiA-like predicted nuclease